MVETKGTTRQNCGFPRLSWMPSNLCKLRSTASLALRRGVAVTEDECHFKT